MKSTNSQMAAWVAPEVVLLDIELRDKADALTLIASAIALAHGLDAAPVLRALERREQAASTGLGNGFAVPHARIGGLERPLTLFLRSKTPVEFGAPDDMAVRDFLAILVPADGDRQEHLDLLAVVARLFAERDLLLGLDSARSADDVGELFRVGLARLAALT